MQARIVSSLPSSELGLIKGTLASLMLLSLRQTRLASEMPLLALKTRSDGRYCAAVASSPDSKLSGRLKRESFVLLIGLSISL